jgi:hypothetical protein
VRATGADVVTMTEDAAVGIATQYLQNRFNTEWKEVTQGLKVRINPIDNQFVSDPNFPVTGTGHLVSLSVRQTAGQGASLMQRIRYSPLGFGNQRKLRRYDFYVDPKEVDASGNTMVYELDSIGLDAWSRMKTWAKPYRALPSGELGKSMTGIGGIGGSMYLGLGGGHALFTSVAGAMGAAVSPIAPLVGGYGIVKSAAYLSKSAQTLNATTQAAAVHATSDWVRAGISAGETPNLSDAYRYYTDQLSHDNVGAHLAPMNAYDFSRQLREQQL